MTQQDYELLGITSQAILDAMLFGFGFVIFCWFSGYIVAIAKTAINKIQAFA